MRFYKSKPFLISLTVALVLVTASVTMAVLGITAPLKNAVATVLSPLQWCADRIGRAADGFISYFTEFQELQEENEQLRRELAEAQDQLHRAALAEEENAFLREFLSLPDMESELSVLDAQIIALLNYGADAQNLFNYNRNNLANSILTADQKEAGAMNCESVYAQSNDGTNGANIKSVSLLLNNRVGMKMMIDAIEGVTAYTLQVSRTADFAEYAETIRTLQAQGKGVKTILGGADAVKASGMFDEANIKEL